ncbi:MAG TPA: hypothetical protein VFW21_09690 [Mycobacterium sp.]|nr:hypothetical protein [Mycobacterium sp.]
MHGAFAQCLHEHGVSEPAGGSVGPAAGPVAAPAGVDQHTWDSAIQACATLEPGPAHS